MSLKIFKSTRVLNYREEKPVVHSYMQLIYPKVKYKELVKYISQSSNVPESTIEAAIMGITEAIAYFAINGYRVVMPNFGGFYMNLRSKSVPTPEEFSVEKCVKTVRLAYAPCAQLRDELTHGEVQVVTGGVYGGKASSEN